MKRLTGICKYTLTSLFFLMVQFHYLMAQVVVEEPTGGHPLNSSPLRVFFYMIISFIVIAVVFKLLYRPKKKPNP